MEDKFVERLEILRKKHGYSKYKISQLLKCETPDIKRIYEKNSKPYFDRLLKIADIFNVSLDYLVGRSDVYIEIDSNVKNEDFLTRLLFLKEKIEISTHSLAKELNMKQASIFNIVKGKSKPNFYTLIKLADFFDVSLDWLTGRSDNPKWE